MNYDLATKILPVILSDHQISDKYLFQAWLLNKFWKNFEKMEPSAAAGFGHLFSWRHPATIDLNHAAYRYNQNMMEYYTCKSKFLGGLIPNFWGRV